MYIAATQMNREQWKNYGIHWLRSAKSEGLTGFIIGKDLPSDAEEKSKKLGFDIAISNNDKYISLVENLKGRNCLLTQPNVMPKGNLIESKDLICEKDDSDVLQIISPVKNLYDRAKVYKLLNKRLFFSNNFILGTCNFWHDYLAFLVLLHEKKYLDRNSDYDKFALNLYVFFTESLKVGINVCS